MPIVNDTPEPSPPASDRVRLRRLATKGRYDRATVHAILDATALCHLAFVHDGHPMVIPTLQARVGEVVYVHASVGSRIGLAAAGPTPVPVSLSVTIVDGIVLARSGFHHSMNHRSVVVVGDAVSVQDRTERLTALRALTDQVVPGRWDELRPPTEKELRATAVLRLGLDEVSAKVRTGDPEDAPQDVDPQVWAGVLPLRMVAGDPVPAADVDPDVPPPPSVLRERERRR